MQIPAGLGKTPLVDKDGRMTWPWIKFFESVLGGATISGDSGDPLAGFVVPQSLVPVVVSETQADLVFAFIGSVQADGTIARQAVLPVAESAPKGWQVVVSQPDPLNVTVWQVAVIRSGTTVAVPVATLALAVGATIAQDPTPFAGNAGDVVFVAVIQAGNVGLPVNFALSPIQ